jgi:hypothetical protein
MFTKNTVSNRPGVGVSTTTYITKLVKVVGSPAAANPPPYECEAVRCKFCLMDENAGPTIRDLYPHHTNKQLAEVEFEVDKNEWIEWAGGKRK